MATKRLTINIEGEAMTGKTHTAALIAQALKGVGATVVVDDEDLSSSSQVYSAQVHKRLTDPTLLRDVGVTIKTKRLQREATHTNTHVG